MEEDTDPYLNFLPYVTLRVSEVALSGRIPEGTASTPDIPNDATPLTGTDNQVPHSRPESDEPQAMSQAVVTSETPQGSRLDILTAESPLNAEELQVMPHPLEVAQQHVQQPAPTTSIKATPALPSLLDRLADPAPLDQAVILALFNRPEFLENRKGALAVLGFTLSDVPSDRIMTKEEIGGFVQRPEFKQGGQSRAVLARALVDADGHPRDEGSFRSLFEHMQQCTLAEKQAEEKRQAAARAQEVQKPTAADTPEVPLLEQWRLWDGWHKFNAISEGLIAKGLSGFRKRPCPPKPSGPRPKSTSASGPSSAASKKAKITASSVTKAKSQTASKTTIAARGSSHAVTRNGKHAMKGNGKTSISSTVRPASRTVVASGTTAVLALDSAGPSATAGSPALQPQEQSASELGALAMAFGSLGLAIPSPPPPEQSIEPSTGSTRASAPQVPSPATSTSAREMPKSAAVAKAKARATLALSGLKTEVSGARKGKGRAVPSTAVMKMKATHIKKPETQSSTVDQDSAGQAMAPAEQSPAEPTQTLPQAGSSRTTIQVPQTVSPSQPRVQRASELAGLAMAFGSLGLAAASLPPPQESPLPSTGIAQASGPAPAPAPDPQVAARATSSAKVTASAVALAKAKARASLTSSGIKTDIAAAAKGKGRATASTSVLKSKATQIKKPGTQSSNGTQVLQGTPQLSVDTRPAGAAQKPSQAGSSRTAVEVPQAARVVRRASPSDSSLQNARSSALPYDRTTRPAPTSRSPTPPRSSVSSGLRSRPTGSSVAGSSGVSVAQGRGPLAAVTAPLLSLANSENSLNACQRNAKPSKTSATPSSANSPSSSTSVVAHPLGSAVNQETADGTGMEGDNDTEMSPPTGEGSGTLQPDE